MEGVAADDSVGQRVGKNHAILGTTGLNRQGKGLNGEVEGIRNRVVAIGTILRLTNDGIRIWIIPAPSDRIGTIQMGMAIVLGFTLMVA